jgi:nucleoside 2-deoxyribosyltransferase
MPIMSKGRTLAFIAGTLAEAFRPGAEKRPVASAPGQKASRVFFADISRLQTDAYEQRDHVEALCAQHGLKAEWPSEHYFFPTGLTISERTAVGPPIDDPRPARALRNAWTKIVDCDALIAEATPFRGPHLSALVAFEIGVAVAAEIPVFAWTTALFRQIPGQPPKFKELAVDRVWCGPSVAGDGNWRSEEDGTLVESFDLIDHAQIAGNFVSISDSREAAIRRCAAHLRHAENR